ncbi:hypothetical protein Tco_0915866 [Tanacetum coccineum]
MSWLRRIVKLRESAQSNNWEDVLVLYCWRAKEEDLKVARMINKLCVKLSDEIKEHRMFTQELDASPGWVIIKEKTSEFLQELAERDEERVRQLQALARETKEMAEEKMEFIEKLKGSTVAFMHATSPKKSLTLIIFLNIIDMSWSDVRLTCLV